MLLSSPLEFCLKCTASRDKYTNKYTESTHPAAVFGNASLRRHVGGVFDDARREVDMAVAMFFKLEVGLLETLL